VSSATTITSGVAGRYAVAVFDLAGEADQLDAVGHDLSTLRRLTRENADLARLIDSPLLSRRDQARAIMRIAEQAGFCDLSRRFLGLVAHNHRLGELEHMIKAYQMLLAEHRGEMIAQVTSAQGLSVPQLEAVTHKLSAWAAREVTLATRIDPDLVGGLVVRIGSTMIDASIKRRIDALGLAMKEGG